MSDRKAFEKWWAGWSGSRPLLTETDQKIAWRAWEAALAARPEERTSGYTLSGASFYRQAIMDSVGSILSEYAAKKIIERAEAAAAKEASLHMNSSGS
jgi:hypothetical protein